MKGKRIRQVLICAAIGILLCGVGYLAGISGNTDTTAIAGTVSDPAHQTEGVTPAISVRPITPAQPITPGTSSAPTESAPTTPEASSAADITIELPEIEWPEIEWPDGGEIDAEDGLSGIPEAGGYGIDLINDFLISGSSGNFLFLDGTRIVTTLYPICMVIGLLVLMISWGMNAARRAIRLELYDGKSLLKACLPLLGGILFMPLSYAALELVNVLCGGLTQAFIGSTDVNIAEQLQEYAGSYDDYASDVPIIGAVIQLINYFLSEWHLLITNLMFLILSIFVAVTIGVRVVKLAIYQGTAPVFIGLSVGEESKPYTRNFFALYIQTAVQLPIIAILMGAFQIAYTSYLNSVSVFDYGSMFIGTVLMLVLAITVVKSDKLFARVFH